MAYEGEVRVNRLDSSRRAIYSNGQWYEVSSAPAGGAPKESYLPQGLQKDENARRETIAAAASSNATLAKSRDQLARDDLNLGPVLNVFNTVRNAVGWSSPESKNYASFRASLEKMRNDSLRLNKGVQTEGDAQRAWNELFNNLSDEGVVQQRLAEIEAINDRAIAAQASTINQQRTDRGLYPLSMDRLRGTANPALNAASQQQRDAAAQFQGRGGKPGTQVNPYVPRTRAEFNALRPGAWYIASDGSVGQKRGGGQQQSAPQRPQGRTSGNGYRILSVED